MNSTVLKVESFTNPEAAKAHNRCEEIMGLIYLRQIRLFALKGNSVAY